jgi:branched-subunit amino acid transport protein
MTELETWLMLLTAALATYAWRFIGVLLSGRIDPEGPLFRWISAVAYALLAGLIARMILLPVGPLAGTGPGARLGGAAAALAAFFLFRRSLFAGVVAGAVVLVAITYAGDAYW